MIAKDNNNKTGQEHHAFFQEQMLELEREQKQFAQSDGDDGNGNGNGNGNNGVNEVPHFGVDNEKNSPASSSSTSSSSSSFSSFDLDEQLNDWNVEQMQVFGEKLTDHDDGGSNIPTNSSTNDDDDANTNDDDDTEFKKEELEARYEFSFEETAAWGKPPPDQDEMRTILEQVAMEREKELEYAKSASLSPPPPSTSNTPQTKSDKDNTDDDRNSCSNTAQQQQQHHESFSHVSKDGAGVHMVDVGRKAVTPRMAHARSEVWLPPSVLEAFLPNTNMNSLSSSSELVGPKGPIFATAKIAGIMAAKKTSDLIPLCHPLPLDQVQLEIRLKDDVDAYDDADDDGGGKGAIVVIDCVCRVTHKTGVEMEALTGAMVAALTIYDMTKAVSHNIRITETRLIGKTGGKRTVLDGREENRTEE